MSDLTLFGRVLIVVGGGLLVLGLVFLLHDRVPYLGKLPGDFSIKKDNVTFYFPLTTMLIVSVVLTLVLNLFGRGR